MGNGNEPEAHVRRDADPLTQTVARVVDEVHACTHSLGQLSAEVSALAGEQTRMRLELGDIRVSGQKLTESINRALERLAAMRQKLASVPGDTEDTARHEVDKLRRELDDAAKREADQKIEALEKLVADADKRDADQDERDRQDKIRSVERRWLMLAAVFGPPLGGLIVYIAHMLIVHAK